MAPTLKPLKHVPRGRGASGNPSGRFETKSIVPELPTEPWEEAELAEDLKRGPRTEVFPDNTKSVLTKNDSPDIAFTWSLNPYRGCEHGCGYCYARPYHEYLGLSAGLDFESKIFAKHEAAALLRKELAKKSWKPETVVMSGVTDCYQPIERELKITRACLEVFLEFKNPVAIITKNRLVARDIDILAELSRYKAAGVYITLPTLDAELAGKLEPRASRPSARLETIRELAKAGIPVGISLAPVIPGLNDHEIPAILRAARDAGARRAFHTILRLPGAVAQIFSEWLEANEPLKKERILSLVRDVRGGQLNDSNFKNRMTGIGERAEQIHALFQLWYRKLNFGQEQFSLSTAHFTQPRPASPQLGLFDGLD